MVFRRLPTGSGSYPPAVATKSVSQQCYTSTGGKITPTENHCFGVRLLAGCVTFNLTLLPLLWASVVLFVE